MSLSQSAARSLSGSCSDAPKASPDSLLAGLSADFFAAPARAEHDAHRSARLALCLAVWR